MTTNDLWENRHLVWLKSLTKEECDCLCASAKRRFIPAGEIIFMPDRTPDLVYFLESGLTRIYRISARGSETTLGYVTAGEVFGELAIFNENPRESFARTMEASWVWEFPRRQFQRLVQSHPGMSFEITKQITTRFKQMESRAERTAVRDVRTRVILALLDLAENVGRRYGDGSIELEANITQGELASLVGSTRQSVNASVQELLNAGLLTRSGKHMIIRKPQELYYMGSEREAPVMRTPQRCSATSRTTAPGRISS